MKLELKNSLSVKLLRVVLLSALIVGVVLSVAQIVFDAYKTRQAVAGDAQRILDMFRDPSTQAVYSLDREMGMQVIEGLFQDDAVRMASIGHPNETMLAEKSRALQQAPSRWLTDLILGRERTFTTALVGKGPYSEYYGDLSITLDTATYGQGFIVNSVIIFISGVLRALAMGLVLYLVYHWLLTKPLSRIIEHLTSINPDRPSEHKIPQLKGHERNELGLWINTANQLLESIERNTHLRHEAESSLLRMAQYDFLTGLPNRQKLQEQLDKILIDAGRRQRRVAVLCVGLDDFKSVNEQFTYQAGDKLLLALADRLRAHSGRLGALARLGGDQFALVQADIDQPYEAAELAQSILDDLEAEFALDHEGIRLRATIGITLFPEDGDSTEKLLQKAEQTMTLAKTRSRNRYQFYIASVDSEMRRRRELEKDLREALSRDQFHLVYQPQISYRDHRVVGVEALIRWQHPEHGLVPPDLFIPLAEQNGTIIPIGEWVLDQACRQLREWHDLGFTDLRMAVNLSTVQLHHTELPRVVNNLMQIYRLPPRSLELEVTETGLMEDISTAAQHLLSLRRSGALIAIDDFGTGYSSLSYLKSLPLDKIKIDKSFVQDLLDDDDDATIVRAIIQLGKSLGMQVIAEGVETAEQEAYIISEGCHEGQGYHYSKPLQARELAAFLKQSERNNAVIL
ncbi:MULTISPECIES: putative bifunctional diguanylate cyclase/phosphodiesterase [unclassified Pseudomonas]|uniref:putative bifunctional diguanylate cyclase/phosphodiesterase n=1 Tax=unclassified Pseudomonas TaxID=196821 RepID=UPI0008BC46F6|nr:MULTISPECIES: bifunctional diguanylate cyclase/phosphodiesterase [unclassified Pseudomonas]PMV23024.1 bifunctional diguanylate cyclase/phosphodiesterase [Pseudomonas sp. FW305-3-2-15-C-TSA2]PMV29781.1 bifunctional diguanylate cyclase/phosphodiesterase [Pseudomonas sp. DP16D-L5]PMV39852.1 bifunctional diguanylate cyclase/phosphodiesterase [Pseudomonas sp. FW305-3-2-15-A-LB2]PMV46181.1 bifunctional diguanylate cyclase/phosphodiesterase [Pseudomonas sp. FW305-3-2-15-C-R2A1]PMV51563.1 bifunctio